jgi:fibronectin type 3 domain-containing protein
MVLIICSGYPLLAFGSVVDQDATISVDDVISSHVAEVRLLSDGRLMTAQDVQAYISTVGVREAGVDYNVLVGGHGTGLAPPTQAEWDALIGEAVLVDFSDPAPGYQVSAPSNPSSYDLSTQPYFPAVGDQGSQGSCAAWASTYYTFGYVEARNRDYTEAHLGTNASQLMSPAWTYNRANGGLNGGAWMSNCFKVACDWGVASMATMPYDQDDYLSWGTSEAFREAPLHQATDLMIYDLQNQSAVDMARSRIAQNLPLTFALDAEFIYDLPRDSQGNYVLLASAYDPSESVNHAQTVVGYDDDFTFPGSTEVGAFKIVNSWGTDYADGGFYWITYAAFMEMSTNGGFGLMSISPKIDYSPGLLAVWRFDAAPLRNASLVVGIGHQTTPLSTCKPYYRSDKAHSMPSFMCLDISCFEPILDAGTTNMWLKVLNGGSGEISSFKIERYAEPYVPDSPRQISYQSPSVPASTPGTAVVDFSIFVSVATIPSAPTLVSATPGDSEVVLAWTAPLSDGGATIESYHIYRGTAAEDLAPLADVGVALSYADTAVINGQTYYYCVSASNEVGEGSESALAYAKPAKLPGAPILLLATGSVAGIHLNWSAPTEDGGDEILGYLIYRGTAPGSLSQIASLNSTSFNDTGLQHSTAYYYEVRAFNSLGTGPSASSSAVTAGLPGAPRELTAAPGLDRVIVSWSAPSNDSGAPIACYHLYRGLNESTLSLLAVVNGLQYEDLDLVPGTEYLYAISASNAVGEGPRTIASEGAASLVPPSSPQDLQAQVSYGRIHLHYDSPLSDGGASILTYRVYRGPSGSTLVLLDETSGLDFVDMGVEEGRIYYYRVCAVNAAGEGETSSTVSAEVSTPVSAPSSPRNLTAVSQEGQILLSWEPPADSSEAEISHYLVYRTSPNGTTLLVAEVRGTCLADKGAMEGVEYTYAVAAVNSAGESEASTVLGTLASAPSGQLSVGANLLGASASLAVLAGCAVSAFLITYGARLVIVRRRQKGNQGP